MPKIRYRETVEALNALPYPQNLAAALAREAGLPAIDLKAEGDRAILQLRECRFPLYSLVIDRRYRCRCTYTEISQEIREEMGQDINERRIAEIRRAALAWISAGRAEKGDNNERQRT